MAEAETQRDFTDIAVIDGAVDFRDIAISTVIRQSERRFADLRHEGGEESDELRFAETVGKIFVGK
ncbi:MAG: hypothetical protein QF797_20900, partial [Alphaproteobacteria bacterium]|nr:hypothetical protein [Alphaproteobacteria bacterium]